MSYKDTVLPIIRSVRNIVLQNHGTVESLGSKTDRPFDIVTEIDKNVENFLKENLVKVYPEIKFVGEEYGGDRDAKCFWLVDPIDGTAHYMRGLPFCTTMLVLIDNGEVVFSAIYDFLNDDMYWAEKGNGAYKNDTKIHVSDRSLNEAYVSIETKIFKKENQILFGEIGKKAALFNSINAGWEFAMVASGKLDARLGFDPYGKDYDFSPGSLIVAEAGGIVTNVNKDTYDYRDTSHIACNPVIYEELKNILKDHKISN